MSNGTVVRWLKALAKLIVRPFEFIDRRYGSGSKARQRDREASRFFGIDDSVMARFEAFSGTLALIIAGPTLLFGILTSPLIVIDLATDHQARIQISLLPFSLLAIGGFSAIYAWLRRDSASLDMIRKALLISILLSISLLFPVIRFVLNAFS